MEETSMLNLLLADEESLRRTLRANRSVDKNREAAAYLDSFGSNEPTTNPRRTHDEASDAKGGAL